MLHKFPLLPFLNPSVGRFYVCGKRGKNCFKRLENTCIAFSSCYVSGISFPPKPFDVPIKPINMCPDVHTSFLCLYLLIRQTFTFRMQNHSTMLLVEMKFMSCLHKYLIFHFPNKLLLRSCMSGEMCHILGDCCISLRMHYATTMGKLVVLDSELTQA